MAIVIENKQLTDDFYLMKVSEKNNAEKGQFYMLRAWDTVPVLSRPISIYDADSETISFLYKVVGKGTKIFSTLQQGDPIYIDGPHGNGFPPDISGKIALVGGGVGIAPLYLAAKDYKQNEATTVDCFLGFSQSELLTEEFEKVCDNVSTNVGGFITDFVVPEKYDYILTCGPTVMMKVLFEKAKKAGVAERVFVSLENRMACGIGSCLVCSCKTTDGNKKVCKDGPVFKGSEVFDCE